MQSSAVYACPDARKPRRRAEADRGPVQGLASRTHADTYLFPPERRHRAIAAVMDDITKAKNLNPPRRERTYPRVVKRARHNSYRVKRPGDHGTCHDGPATISLVNLRSLSLAS
jgi:hypothetical protein